MIYNSLWAFTPGMTLAVTCSSIWSKNTRVNCKEGKIWDAVKNRREVLVGGTQQGFMGKGKGASKQIEPRANAYAYTERDKNKDNKHVIEAVPTISRE